VVYSTAVNCEFFLLINCLLQLLDRDPRSRLGAGPSDADEIRSHPYFENVDWEKLLKRQVKPPFKPKVVSFFCCT
jgi:hypothetical protein